MYESNRVVILTALSLEFLSVNHYLTDLTEIVHPRGTIYDSGQFATPQGSWQVSIAEVGMGNPDAAAQAERAFDFFNPSLAFFVGVAGGIKDVAKGDVVAATKVYGYEFGKAEKQFRPRPEASNSAFSLVQRARAEARKTEWLEKIQYQESIPMRPRVFVGPIAAGEQVMVDEKSDIYKFVKNQYGDALAVEMEGFGFMRAVLANHQVQAMVVRGISDIVGKGKDLDRQWQPIAASHAAAFTFQMLSKLQPGSDLQVNSVRSKRKSDDVPSNVRQQIFENLSDKFNVSELKTLCFDLNVRYEDLPSARTDMAREIVELFYREGRLSELVKRGKELRPHAIWPNV